MLDEISVVIYVISITILLIYITHKKKGNNHDKQPSNQTNESNSGA